MADDYAVLTYKVEALEKRVSEQDKMLKDIREEEKRKLVWGVGALGSAVLGLTGIIWSYRDVIFRGP